MTLAHALAARRAARLQSEQRLALLRALAFPAQRAFIDDPSRLKAVECSRRAGKSTGIGLEIFEEHECFHGATSLYVGLTRTTCKRIMWKDILERLDSELRWGLVFNRSELSVRSPHTGAVTYFLGADSSDKEREKALGQKYRRVWIDEAQSFRIDLDDLVYSKLGPAVADYDGVISLHGTPGEFIGPKGEHGERRHLFFRATKPDDLLPDEPRAADWSVHRWTALDNPHMREKFERKIAEIEARTPGYRLTPEFQRDYLGRWVLDSLRLVYRFSGELAVPPGPLDSHIVSCDLGYNDPTAFVVGGWREGDPRLYLVHAEKKRGMLVSDVIDRFHELRTQYDAATLLVDGANKQAVEEMRVRGRLPLECAEKHGKEDFIAQMNSDLARGRIVVAPACSPLVEEWRALTWDASTDTAREDPQADNHCSDSALYLFRRALNHFAEPDRPEPKAPRQSADEHMDRWWEEQSHADDEDAA